MPKTLDEKISAAKEYVHADVLYWGDKYGIDSGINDALNVFADTYEEYEAIWQALTAVD